MADGNDELLAEEKKHELSALAREVRMNMVRLLISTALLLR